MPLVIYCHRGGHTNTQTHIHARTHTHTHAHTHVYIKPKEIITNGFLNEAKSVDLESL